MWSSQLSHHVIFFSFIHRVLSSIFSLPKFIFHTYHATKRDTDNINKKSVPENEELICGLNMYCNINTVLPTRMKQILQRSKKKKKKQLDVHQSFYWRSIFFYSIPTISLLSSFLCLMTAKRVGNSSIFESESNSIRTFSCQLVALVGICIYMYIIYFFFGLRAKRKIMLM